MYHLLQFKRNVNNFEISKKKCGADVSILAGPFDSAFDKGPARIETSGPHFFGYLHFGNFSQ